MKIDVSSTKGKIIMAAIRLFPEKGYEGTSMNAIAEAAGVTKPAVYYYFENKEEMFREMIEIGQQHGLKRAQEIIKEEKSFREKLIDLIMERFTIPQKLPELEKFFSWANTNGLQHALRICSRDSKIINMMRKTILDFLKEEVEKGNLRKDIDLDQLLALLAGGINYHTKEHFLMGKGMLDREDAAKMVDILLYNNIENNRRENE